MRSSLRTGIGARHARLLYIFINNTKIHPHGHTPTRYRYTFNEVLESLREPYHLRIAE